MAEHDIEAVPFSERQEYPIDEFTTKFVDPTGEHKALYMKRWAVVWRNHLGEKCGYWEWRMHSNG